MATNKNLSTIRGAAALASLALITACGGSQAPAPQPAVASAAASTEASASADGAAAIGPITSEKALALYDAYTAAVLANDAAKLEAMYADTATVTPASSGMRLLGPKQIVQFFGMFRTAFPDLEQSSILVLASGDTAIGLGLARGTHTESMMGMPATNKKASFYGLEVIRFDDTGKIAEQRVYADNLNFLGQLGMYKGPHRPFSSEPAPAKKIAVAGSGAAEEANAAAIRAQIAKFNAHDAAGVASHYAADARVSNQAAPMDLTGADMIRQTTEQYIAWFPDIAVEVQSVWAVGDWVVATSVMTGTNTADIPAFNLEASGKKIKLEAADVYRMQDGKIAEHWILVDGMVMMMQLGIFQMPGR